MLTTIYAGANWTLSSSGLNESQLFYNCSTTPVGDAGTVWANSKTSYTHLRIDAASTPGYITVP